MVRFSGLADPEYQKVASALRFIHDKIPSKRGKETQDSTTQISDTTAVASTNVSFSSLLPPLDLKEAIEARKELTDLLYFDEIDARLLSLKPALNKTCSWFLEKREYLEWLHFRNYDKHHGFLWIKGKPGAGKSILMKFLEAKTKALAAERPDHVVASFFFFAPGQHLERSTLGLYRSLLWQLFEKAPDLAEVLDSLDSNSRRVLRRTGWQIETLKGTLERAVERLGPRELCLFIDALDECHDDDVADMVDFFEELGDNAADKDIRLRICFSSRYYPTIMLRSGNEVKLDHEEEHSRDITRYIKAKLKLGKSKRAGATSQQILEKSAGIFLWVALVVPILNKAYAGGRMDQLEKCLNGMPPGLDNLFDMILTRDQDDLDDLRLCIQWVLFAIRPLTLSEYFFALRDGDDTDALRCWAEDELDDENMYRFVQNSSKGLAEVTKTRIKTKEPTIQFIHESVRDYFLVKEGKRILWPHLDGDFVAFSHESLKIRCLAEITSLKEQLKLALGAASQKASHNDLEHEDEQGGEDDEKTQMSPAKAERDQSSASCERSEDEGARPGPTGCESRVYKRPFLLYATTGVLQHSDLAQRRGFAQSCFLVDEFPLLLRAWVHLHNKFEIRNSRHFNSNATVIYILAALGLPYLLSVHPELSRHNDRIHWRSGRYYFPFAAAVILKHKEAAQVLAASLNVDPGFATGVGDAVSSLPCQPRRIIKGHHAFFDLLLELDHSLLISHYIKIWPFDFNAWCKGQLFTGVRSGSAAVASLLLKNIINSTPGTFNIYTDPHIHHLFLKGADPNTRGRDGSSALHFITKQCEIFGRFSLYMVSCKSLLHPFNASILTTPFQVHNGLLCGIDRSLKDSLGRTALHYARSPQLILALISHVDVAKTIKDPLDSGIPSDSSTLHTIVTNIDHPDVNAVDNDGKTPLFFVDSGRSVSMLINHGANIHATDSAGKTALFYSKNPETINQLLEHGADVNAVDNTGKTPIFWQVQPRLVDCLRQKGADCKVTDNTGKTPLHTRKSPDSLRYLILEGADVQARDHDGQTPLHWHAQNFSADNLAQTTEIARILIDNGADVFAKDLDGKTPLDLVTDEFLGKKMLEFYNKFHPPSP